MRAFLGIIGLVVIVVAGIWLLTADKNPKVDFSPALSATISPTIPVPSIMKKFEKLITEDIKVGTGAAVKAGDTISINYLGTLTNGTKFDSSYDRGMPFETQIGVGRVIKGWDEGVVGMKVGGKRKLLIPSELGYGARGAGGAIPPNADLIFEVELMGIK